MAKLFSSYTSTVRGMIKAYNSELYNFFSGQNIEEVWIDHDNWNGGIDFYNIVISVPVDFFESLRKNGCVEEVEHTINEYYNYGYYDANGNAVKRSYDKLVVKSNGTVNITNSNSVFRGQY